jgi:arginine exporter protein ArgO
MNTKLLKSKKFRAAIIAAITGILTFATTKFGLNLNVPEITALLAVIMSPFLIYIGAEGYSEALAKKTVEESKAKVEITEKVMQEIINNQNNKDEN